MTFSFLKQPEKLVYALNVTILIVGIILSTISDWVLYLECGPWVVRFSVVRSAK